MKRLLFLKIQEIEACQALKAKTNISVAEFRQGMAAALERAHAGDTIKITKHGKPYAAVIGREASGHLGRWYQLLGKFNNFADLQQDLSTNDGIQAVHDSVLGMMVSAAEKAKSQQREP